LHKLDVLHWHLTDDQGWRIEIKQYPELTNIGAWRIPASVHGTPPRYGGFYTQDQIRDIVRYAAQRYITVVPEIEMPGHAQAAIAAYPQFGVTGKRPPVSHDWGVHTYLYNVDDSTFTFLENVLTEVMDLFPGQYIHIGGDEAAKDQWQASPRVQQRMRELGIKNEDALQSWFVARIEKFLDAHGRRLIGWDEILQGGLPPRATVMSWQGTKGGIEAAHQGHDVVMAPSPLMYFDHVQSARHDEPPGRPDVVSLGDVYAYEPVPGELDVAQARHILGAQANLWTEYMDTPQRIEHAAFPRVAALAEVLWSPKQSRNWQGFLARLPAQLDRYRALGIDFADSAFAPDVAVAREDGRIEATLSDQAHYGQLHYTLDGSDPTPQSPVYRNPLRLTLPTRLRVRTFAGDRALTATRAQLIDDDSLLRKNSDELQACKPGQGLPLRLPGPSAGGSDGVYRVDIFDPCWIYPQAELDDIGGIAVSAAGLPYNFQLWHDADKVVIRKPATAGGELDVRLDTCNGEKLAAIPLAALAGSAESNATAPLRATLPPQHGRHDLCFYFTRPSRSPMWAIDTVQLLPAARR
jgi:hexosaminidase